MAMVPIVGPPRGGLSQPASQADQLGIQHMRPVPRDFITSKLGSA
jgi:hypothetical protein